MFSYFLLETRRKLRDGGLIIGSLAVPVLMYVVTTTLGGGMDRAAAGAAMVGLGGLGAIGAVLNAGVGVATDRTIGWLRQLRVTPLKPFQVVLAKGLSGMALALPVVLAVALAAGLTHDLGLSPGRWVLVIATMWLATAPFALLGLGIGYLFGAQSAAVVMFVVSFGLSLLGGMWFPPELFPAFLRPLTHATPNFRYAELGWSVLGGHAPPAGSVVIMIGWSVAFVAFAAFAYRRSAARR